MTGLNAVVWISFVAWLGTQGTKYLLSRGGEQAIRFDQTGGMPSAHSAVVASMVTVIGLREGMLSSVFGLAIIIAAIVIHDAVRLRWAVGQQAERINELVLRLKLGKEEQVVVWHGHRIREVVVGLVLGALIALALYKIAYG